MNIRHGDWVMVADGRKALFLCNEGSALEPELQSLRLMEHPNPPTREQGTERPGRQHAIVGQRRSAYEQTDWHELEEQRFAKETAGALYTAAHFGRFERLILVAPPQTLGDLRSEIHKEVSDRVVAEVNKDLTNLAPREIARMLVDRD